ncbi:hypothetical protein ES703_83686 [subsurface metagenome]
MKRVHLYGAFDRFNYGDLLFPLVLKKAIGSASDIDCVCECYGLIASDLRRFGGVITKPISDLDIDKANKDILIVAGGEVLGAHISYLYNCFGKGIARSRIMNKLRLGCINSYIARKKLRVNSNYPFIINKKEYEEICLIYNAVSGENASIEMNEFLTSVDYISIRDKDVYRSMCDKCHRETSLFLYPDSATLISEYFPFGYLETKIGRETKEIINLFGDGYICFQAAERFINTNIKTILSELIALYVGQQFPIVLLPIGRAHMHNDHVGLARIRKHIDVPCVLPKDNTIYDIMYLIANSKLFIGTSLHGNITAMSYAVPYIGLDGRIRKLHSYLQTWGIEGLDGCVDYVEIGSKAKRILASGIPGLSRHSEILVAKAKENIQKIITVIKNY